MTDQEKNTHFKAELHQLIENANEARFQVSKIMNNERARMIEEARENGSEDPTKDVQAFQGRMYRDVQEKLHSDIHALCIKYGYEANKQQVEFHASPEAHGLVAELNGQDHDVDADHAADVGPENDESASAPRQDDDQDQ